MDDIEDSFTSNFEIFNWTEAQTHDVPYDLGSVMHYFATVKNHFIVDMLIVLYHIIVKHAKCLN